MESTEHGPTDPLALAERAAAAPYLTYPELPWWYPAVFGAWFAAMVGTVVARQPSNPLVRGLVVALLIGVLSAFATWYRNQRGVEPSTDHRLAPPEIGRAMLGYYVGAGVAVVVVVACGFLAAPAVTIGVTFVLATAGLAVYEQQYRRAAAAVRARLR